MSRLAVVLIVALVLIVVIATGSALLLPRLEHDSLHDLEQQMAVTAQTLSHNVASLLDGSSIPPTALNRMQDVVVGVQRDSSSRIRIFSMDRRLLVDSAYAHPVNEPADDDLISRPEVTRALNGQYGAFTRFADDSLQSVALYVAVPVLDKTGLRGVVYVSHNTDEVMRRLERYRRPLRIVLGALGALAVLTALALLFSMRWRLEQMRDTTQRISEGALESRLNMKGNDEIAQIAEHFNQLAQSLQKKIDELEDEKDKTRRFIQEITHELKTPLTGLHGSVDALLHGAMRDADASKRFVANVERDTQRLSNLVGELLEYQKLENAALQRTRFDVVSLAETVAESFDAETARRRVTIDVTGTRPTTVEADAAKVRRVLENLMENAIHHSPDGGTVRVRVDADQTIRVQDDGPGVAPEEQSRIFERFYRGTHAAEGRLGGAGLGLAIAREIVTRHGGRIGVESDGAHGATFYFTLS